MARETSEPTYSIDDKQEWLGRDIDNVEIYGSDINGEADFDRGPDYRTAMIIGSAAVAAAAFATIVLIRHQRQRDSEESGYERETEFDAPAAGTRNAGPSGVRRLADRQLQRVSNTIEDIIDALVGVAVGKAVSLIADAVPSFRSEFERTSMSR